MELNFVETIEGKLWVAEFEVPSNFNIHLERAERGSIVIYQRTTTEGQYAVCYSRGIYEGGSVIDEDFGGLVFPKYIKVESSSQIVKSELTLAE